MAFRQTRVKWRGLVQAQVQERYSRPLSMVCCPTTKQAQAQAQARAHFLGQELGQEQQPPSQVQVLGQGHS
jgi:hypothetical protein